MLSHTGGPELLLKVRAQALAADGRRQAVTLEDGLRKVQEMPAQPGGIWETIRRALATGRVTGRPSASLSR